MTSENGLEPEIKNQPAEAEPDSSSSPQMQKTGSFESLRISNFRLFLIGGVLAFATQWIFQIILSWLIYDLTRSGTILGSIVLVMSAASLFMLPVVPLMVDYFDRRKLMLVELFCMFIVTLGTGVILLTGHTSIAYLFVFAFICGLSGALDQNLRQVLVFDMVPRVLTPGAIALNQTGWSVMRVLGPSMGGFLLIWCGAGGSFLVQAAMFLVIWITIFQIKLPATQRKPVRSSPLENIKVGLGYLFKEPATRAFTLIGIVLPILVIPVFSTLPAIYAVEVFHDESGKVLGFLMASVGVGGVIGGIAIAYLKRIDYWGRMQLVSIFLVCLALIGFAFTSSLLLAVILLAVSGFFEIVFLTANQTLIQLSIPDELRSRVSAVISLTWILSPVGSLLAGVGADLFGNPKTITLIMAGAASIIIVLVWLFSPTIRNYRLSQGISVTR
jgi:MFS family permease